MKRVSQGKRIPSKFFIDFGIWSNNVNEKYTDCNISYIECCSLKCILYGKCSLKCIADCLPFPPAYFFIFKWLQIKISSTQFPMHQTFRLLDSSIKNDFFELGPDPNYDRLVLQPIRDLEFQDPLSLIIYWGTHHICSSLLNNGQLH